MTKSAGKNTGQKATGETALCPCDSGISHAVCCAPWLAGGDAPTAEALMRSRYCAYVLGDEAHLLRSWHPQTVPVEMDFDPRQRWLGLKVKRVVAGGENDDQGEVCFVARYKIAGRGFRLEECSAFERLNGRWVYRDGY